MSFPILRTLRERWQHLERDDLHPGESIVGRYIGSKRSDGIWGPVAGTVTLLLLEDIWTLNLIWVPVIDDELRTTLQERPPAEGDLVQVTCMGILALELEILESRSVGRYKIDPDRTMPVLEPGESQIDDLQPHVPTPVKCVPTVVHGGGRR